VTLDLGKGASRCNCSICTKVMQTGAMTKPDALKVLAGESELSTYEWGSKMSKRFFCKHCGVHLFGKGHLAELGGDFASINVNCLDDIDVNALPLMFWDGRHNNWQAGPGTVPFPIVARS
jgi:hypothetical protein